MVSEASSTLGEPTSCSFLLITIAETFTLCPLHLERSNNSNGHDIYSSYRPNFLVFNDTNNKISIIGNETPRGTNNLTKPAAHVHVCLQPKCEEVNHQGIALLVHELDKEAPLNTGQRRLVIREDAHKSLVESILEDSEVLIPGLDDSVPTVRPKVKCDGKGGMPDVTLLHAD